MIDTVRVAELNNELGVVQDSIQRAEQRAGEIIAELRAMLDAQPGQESTPAVSPAAMASSGSPAPVSQPGSARVGQERTPDDPVGTPTPASSSLICSKCRRGGFQRPNSLAMHVKHCDGIGTQRVRVTSADVVRIPHRNPRSVPPLDLPPRLDQAVGE